MKLDDDARKYLYADVTLTVDPTGSTVRIEVDDTPHSMAWQGDPVSLGSGWRQTARTTEMFCGSSVTPQGSDVSLSTGRHMTQVIVSTADGQEIPATVVALDVR